MEGGIVGRKVAPEIVVEVGYGGRLAITEMNSWSEVCGRRATPEMKG